MKARNLLDGIIVILIVSILGVGSAIFSEWYRKKTFGSGGYLAVATHVDPDTGLQVDFKIKRFLDHGENYCKILTSDGDIVEYIGDEWRYVR